jgi:hypothetical protein
MEGHALTWHVMGRHVMFCRNYAMQYRFGVTGAVHICPQKYQRNISLQVMPYHGRSCPDMACHGPPCHVLP